MQQALKHLGPINAHYLWASVIWGAIASGYLVYGWKQKSAVPFIGSLFMMAASIFIFSALEMSLACIAIMAGIWWMMKNF